MTTPRLLALRAAFAGAVALLVLSLALGSCKHGYSTADDPAPGATSDLLAPSPLGAGNDFSRARALFPLAVGNHWDYRIRTRSVITTDAGPQPPQVEETTLTVDITGTATNGELTYFLQEEVPAGSCCGQVFMARGSRFGLFHLQPLRAQQDATIGETPVDAERAALEAYVDQTVTDPAKRAAFQRAAAQVAAKLAAARPVLGGARPPEGAMPGEITLLSYPLYQGKRWIVVDTPRFARIVVGLDRIRVPLGTFAAWKIRGTSELFAPTDRVHFWYSNLGLLRIRFHAEVNAVDNTGAIIGTVAMDSDQSLAGIHLVRPSALAADGD